MWLPGSLHDRGFAGEFVPCVILEVVGAASVTIGGDALGQPTTAFTGHLPGPVAALALLAITLGAISANALNVYSGAMSLLTMGVRLPLTLRRALTALACGVIGFLVALSGLEDAGHKYESFLLVISYWIGPWLGIVLVDAYLRRGGEFGPLLYDRRHTNPAGPIAMVTGVVLSVWLFSNQELYVGLVPERVPAVGDIVFAVGFLISAAVYLALKPLRR